MMLCLLLVFTSSMAVDCWELWRLTDIPHDYVRAFSASHVSDHGPSAVVRDPEGGDNHVLKVTYHKGSWSTHGHTTGFLQFDATPVQPLSAMTLSYDIYFAPNFDFVRGGKLPGLYGGSNHCSGGRHSDDCFSTRFMWRSHGDGEVYAYISPRDEQVPGFCDDKHCNSVYGYSLGRGDWRFRRGEWQNIAQYVKLNTPGRTDGVIRVWFNHKLVYEEENVSIRQTDSVKIDGIFFSTFFGGGDSSWASTRDTFTCYKNFVLSTNAHHPIIVG
ncbi:uncharacterized protein LOC121390574 [Gigantopelta aegis]|uniref:uncharacterized protein LOC121390574 n=1 Tax=Gigantopelta aegis TaxID=1735272 RepID=UPI001B88D43D|nr:uncharacterized protein LOC121390574 [Gigantopelta aegis]